MATAMVDQLFYATLQERALLYQADSFASLIFTTTAVTFTSERLANMARSRRSGGSWRMTWMG